MWKEKLDNEYTALSNGIRKEVNITDFGAVGDGVTDCTKAFEEALNGGYVKVIIPEGTFITRGIRLPSHSMLRGQGKGRTILKLHDEASRSARLITNSQHVKGNSHILVEHMTLNWNVERLKDIEITSAGGHYSSCLTYANVQFGWVNSVEAVNPGLHCFDISSALYNYSGDGFRAKRGSRYIWLNHLTGSGFGDDGITTHHSDYIFISNSHMADPSGRAHKEGFSNSNGIEVDDGSRHVVLMNNSTARCFGGVEIKAHHNSSAAANTQIIGHLSVHDNRSYNFRHIGHHQKEDPESLTACDIRATQLVAIEPVFTSLYKDSSPRALVVSAYRNVVVNHFLAIGDPLYDYQKNPVFALQYRSRNITLKNVIGRYFKRAGTDIRLYGGGNRTDNVRIVDSSFFKSAGVTVTVGAGLTHVEISNLKAVLEHNGKCLDLSPTANVDTHSVRVQQSR
ncbi:pectate lyase [Bacillus lacus]|uniref:Pectate lyase n=2 Tax=Metabacillus lacus TaxID=1983721 RepID=A0A7X2LXY1_9BACI|nr:pectate lyase [Metabacillus lacus]